MKYILLFLIIFCLTCCQKEPSHNQSSTPESTAQNSSVPAQNTPPPAQNTPPPAQNTPPPAQNTPPPAQNTSASAPDSTATYKSLSSADRLAFHLPAEDELTLSKDADNDYVKNLSPDVHQAVQEYLKPQKVEWRIEAARLIGNHILLWISFPEIYDGGADLIYSIEQKKIVGSFIGGYRG